ncbi:MAG: 4Fe-4S binding protein [Ignavibacteria bacterium]|nr:4Fe-4S binding protein [Ignavibacteria bacterium]
MKDYFKHIYKALTTIWIGMMITFKSMFKKSVTIQYPEQRLQLPERERNRLFVNMDDCIGCDQCAKACPVSCIEIETIKAVPGDVVGKTGQTSQGKKKALFVPKFTIDFAKCCFCQLCVFPCPTDCIYMTEVFEYSEFKREYLVYEFTDMSPDMAEEKRKKLADYQEEQTRKKEEAEKTAAAATAPAGSATSPEPPRSGESPEPSRSEESPEPSRSEESPEPPRSGVTPEPSRSGESPEPVRGLSEQNDTAASKPDSDTTAPKSDETKQETTPDSTPDTETKKETPNNKNENKSD